MVMLAPVTGEKSDLVAVADRHSLLPWCDSRLLSDWLPRASGYTAAIAQVEVKLRHRRSVGNSTVSAIPSFSLTLAK
jgi:hypothetical protein